jgi:hypothetical protein
MIFLKLFVLPGELAGNGVDVIDSKNTGNIAKHVITLPNATFTKTYSYDSLDRITEAKETAANNATTWQQSWDYDRFGNRLNFSSNGIGLESVNTTPAVDPLTNRFVSTQDFGYDKTGNVIKDRVNGNVRNFVFNGDHKQVQVKDANNNPMGNFSRGIDHDRSFGRQENNRRRLQKDSVIIFIF